MALYDTTYKDITQPTSIPKVNNQFRSTELSDLKCQELLKTKTGTQKNVSGRSWMPVQSRLDLRIEKVGEREKK